MKNYIITLCYLMFSSALCAQFSGGVGDGTTVYFGVSYLDGSKVNIYNGGNADGVDRALVVSLGMTEDCDYNIVIDGDAGDNSMYQADYQVSISGIITASNVTVNAGDEIVFIPLLEINPLSGAFEINIEDCPK